jgi:hypothetical protein
MTSLVMLWLPILLSAVAVFIASSIIHMALPWHKSDYPKMPNEGAVIDSLRPLAIPPGDYMVPGCDNMTEMRTPEFKDKLNRGPVMIVTVMPNGPFSMGRNLSLWFIYCLVIGVFAAYVTGRALPPGADHAKVLQIAGATAFIAYALGIWQMTIWYQRSLVTTMKSTIDGIVYGLLTGGVFAWLWP